MIGNCNKSSQKGGENVKYINRTEAISLSQLILGGELGDGNVIQIFDADGNFICQGTWYSDCILERRNAIGQAHKAGTGRTIQFKLI